MEARTHRISALKAGSTGLGGAVVQSAALIAPAAGATAGFVFIASESGFASPFSMVVGMVFSLCLAVIIGEFARKLPAAGSFYNYLTHAFGPKVGFVTGVMLFGAYVLLLPFQMSLLQHLHQRIPGRAQRRHRLAVARGGAHRVLDDPHDRAGCCPRSASDSSSSLSRSPSSA